MLHNHHHSLSGHWCHQFYPVDKVDFPVLPHVMHVQLAVDYLQEEDVGQPETEYLSPARSHMFHAICPLN